MGPNCPHSHNIFESWLHPQKYRTLLCKDKDRCTRPVCFFAHGAEQLRTPSEPISAPNSSLSLLAATSSAGPIGGISNSLSQLAVLPQEAVGHTVINGSTLALPEGALIPTAVLTNSGFPQQNIQPMLIRLADQAATGQQDTQSQLSAGFVQAEHQLRSLDAVLAQHGAAGIYRTSETAIAGSSVISSGTALPTETHQLSVFGSSGLMEEAAGRSFIEVTHGASSAVLQLPIQQQLLIGPSGDTPQQRYSLDSTASNNSLLWVPMTSVSASGMATHRLCQAAAAAATTYNMPSGRMGGISWSNAFQGASGQVVGSATMQPAVMVSTGLLLQGAGNCAVLGASEASPTYTVLSDGGSNYLANQYADLLGAPQTPPVVLHVPVQSTGPAPQSVSCNLVAPQGLQVWMNGEPPRTAAHAMGDTQLLSFM